MLSEIYMTEWDLRAMFACPSVHNDALDIVENNLSSKGYNRMLEEPLVSSAQKTLNAEVRRRVEGHSP